MGGKSASRSCPGDSTCFDVPAPATSGSCTYDSDCPGSDECFRSSDGNTCATPCTQNTDCGDNQTCMSVSRDGSVKVCADLYPLCLNPDAATSQQICPDDYTCSGSDATTSDPCDGVSCPSGQVCDNGQCVDNTTGGGCPSLGQTPCPDSCGNDYEACLTSSSLSNFCSCTCSTDADCGDNGLCVVVEGTSDKYCVPDNSSTGPCDGVSCPSGQVCDNGQCVDDGTSGGDTGGGGSDAGSGGDTNPCTGLGNTCGSNSCTPENDVCLEKPSGDSICSCRCTSDADCGPGGVCKTFGNGSACVLDTSTGGGGSDAGTSDASSTDAGSGGGGGGSLGPVPGSDAGVVYYGGGGGDDGGCSTTGPNGSAPASLALLAVFGLGIVWRRRRD